MENDTALLLYHDKAYCLGENEEITLCDFSHSSSLFTAALIPTKLLTPHAFTLPASLDADELAIQTEIKMYNEANLNPNENYLIDYIAHKQESNYIIEAFAAKESDVEQLVEPYAKSINAIDLLFPRFLIYQTLYEKSLDNEKNDIFLYISHDEAYAAMYKKGRYIGHRLFDTIEDISKKTGIEAVQVTEYLNNKGFVRENYNADEYHILDALQEIFMKSVEKLVYTLNSKRKVFAYSMIDTLYIDSPDMKLQGLEEFFQSFGYYDLRVEQLPFDEKAKKFPEIANVLTYAKSVAEEDSNCEKLNFTTLERKKPLLQYVSVHYILLTLFTLLLITAAYIYTDMKLNSQREQLSAKKALLSKKEQMLKRLKTKEKSLQKVRDKLKDKNKELQKKKYVYATTIKVIPKVRQNIQKRQKFLYEVVQTLAKYRLNTLYIDQNNSKQMELKIVTERFQRDAISKFMQELIKKGYKSVETNSVKLDENIYTSKIRIEK